MTGRRGAGSAAYQTPSEEALLSRRIYDAYSGEQSEWAAEAAADLEFYNGAHWTDEQIRALKERQQKPVEINVTYQLVQQAVAMLTSRNPSFRATGREDSDQSYATMISHLQQWIWQQSNGNARAKQTIRDYYTRGLGFLYAYVDPNADYGKGEVRVQDLDPFDVFVDPHASDPLFDDAAHIIVRRLMTAEQIRGLWPTAPLEHVNEHTGANPGYQRRRVGSHNMRLYGSGRSKQLHKTYEVLERFTKVDRPHFRVQDPTTGQEQILTQEEFQAFTNRDAYIVQTPEGPKPVINPGEVAALDELYNEMGETFHLQRQAPAFDEAGRPIEQPPQPVEGPEDGPQSVPGSTQTLTPTTIEEVIERGLIEARRFLLSRIKVVATVGDFELYEPFDLPISDYPTVPFVNGHNRNPYPISDVRRVRDLQELINKTQSLILAHTANSTNLKVFYPNGSIQDPEYMEEKWNAAGAALIEYNPDYGQRGGIEIASPPPLPGELYTNMDRFISLMERTLGIFSLQQGDAQQAPTTFKGTVAIDEYGMRRIKSKMDDIYSALSRVGQVTTELAQHLYRPDKVLRLTEPNGTSIEARLGVPGPETTDLDLAKFDDMMTSRYDMIVVSGSTLPSNRWMLLEQYLQMYDRGIVDDIAVLKKTEIPEAEAVLQRKSMYSQLTKMVDSLQGTVQDLQGDLQTANREAMHANKKAELEKFKARLDGYEKDVGQAKELFQRELSKEKEKQQALFQQERSLRSQDLRASDSPEG